jgi:hypothetical protein
LLVDYSLGPAALALLAAAGAFIWLDRRSPDRCIVAAAISVTIGVAVSVLCGLPAFAFGGSLN